MTASNRKIEFEGKQFEIADIKSNNGMKKEIVRLVLHAPTPDRQCELTDFLMCLQAIIDKHLIEQVNHIAEQAVGEVLSWECSVCRQGYWKECGCHIDGAKEGAKKILSRIKQLTEEK